MKLPIYQVDAFAERPFEGNPAAVVPLRAWLPAQLMQAIAAENNLSETAFFVPSGTGFDIRWFTPLAEVKLCGHATLATAFVLYHYLDYAEEEVRFDSLSGPLSVRRIDRLLQLDFPAQAPVRCELPGALAAALGREPIACYSHDDLLAVFASEADIAAIKPDFGLLASLETRGVIVTAPGDDVDFVARFFAPRVGVPEDPVTGSAYTQLTPYWAERSGKTCFRARQLSARGGNLHCELDVDRVHIAGTAIGYLRGEIEVDT
jgi:PhzF family phenazine biosynthesis protein